VILGVKLVSEAEFWAPFLIMIIESNYYLFGAILLPTQIMWLSPIFERFVEKSPITVIIRAMMEVVLVDSELDDLFNRTAQTGYTRELLFSTLVKMMTEVVCSTSQSIGSVYKEMATSIGVSKTAVYDKLNRLEPDVSQALVKDTASKLEVIINTVGISVPSLLPNYKVKILDGNTLGATEHRLGVLQNTRAGALPGKSIAVLSADLGIVTDVFLCEDGHAQERSLLPEVLETVETGDLWIGDRNFCTQEFIFGIISKGGNFIIRQHKSLPWQAINELVYQGQTDGGEVFYQDVLLEYSGIKLNCRRIVVKLEKPTRDGETEIAILTNIPSSHADSILVSQLYRKRWRVETLFQVVTQTFHCEIKTLGYPRAALFSFCMALVAYNLFACLKVILSSVHGVDKIEGKLSSYYLSAAVEGTYKGMMIALPDVEWERLGEISLTEFSQLLQDWARFVNLSAFTSSPRKPKEKKQKPRYDPKHPHVSTARLLEEKKSKSKNKSKKTS
jgi:Transposase DDE domain